MRPKGLQFQKAGGKRERISSDFQIRFLVYIRRKKWRKKKKRCKNRDPFSLFAQFYLVHSDKTNEFVHKLFLQFYLMAQYLFLCSIDSSGYPNELDFWTKFIEMTQCIIAKDWAKGNLAGTKKRDKWERIANNASYFLIT